MDSKYVFDMKHCWRIRCGQCRGRKGDSWFLVRAGGRMMMPFTEMEKSGGGTYFRENSFRSVKVFRWTSKWRCQQAVG